MQVTVWFSSANEAERVLLSDFPHSYASILHADERCFHSPEQINDHECAPAV